MKKILLSIATVLGLCTQSNAQVGNFAANYIFSSSVGSYAALSSPTVLTSGSGMDEAVSTVTLAAPLSINGATFNVAYVSENGWVTFGGISPGTNYAILSTGTASFVIAPFSRDNGGLDATSEMSWSEAGTDVVFQWKNIRRYASAGESLNFQVRIDKTTGIINIVYGTCVAGSNATYPQVGIRGNSTTWAPNVNNLTITTSTANCSWASALTGPSNTSTMYFNSANPLIIPNSGLTFTWKPATLAPPVRIIGAATSVGSTSAVINFTLPAGPPTALKVQVRPANTCAWVNSGVFSSAATYTVTGLTAGTAYEYRLKSYVSLSDSSIYSHIATFTTCIGTPVAGTTTAASTIICSPSNLALALTGASSGFNYQWQSSPDGVTWTDISGANSATRTQSVLATTYYQNVLSCGSATAASSPILVTLGGTPTGGSTASTFTTICTSQNVALSLTGASTYPGLAYQWQSSTDGVTWTSISTATNSTRTQSVLATTYYQNILTCGSSTASSTPILVSIAPTTTNTAPYFEGFEGITANNQLPNCSWLASNLPTICKTYTAATGSYNQMAKTGTKYASFRYGTNTSGDYFYSNGVLLNAGTTYFASADYITDGASGWSNFSLLYGTTQTTVGLTSIASVTGSLTNTVYANLTNTFTVGSTGIYYIAVKGIGNSGPWYLTFDDLRIGTCAPPTSVAVNSIAQTSLNVTWSTPSTGSPANYIYEVRTSGAAGSGATGLATTGTVTAPTTSVNATGLTALTAYTVYVMADCGAGSMSTWSTPKTFTTLAACPVPTSLTISALTPTSAVSNWTGTGTVTMWDVYYGPAPLAVPNATTAPTGTTSTTSYTLTPLTPSTAYAVYVRSNCGSGITSIWTPLTAFTTPCLPPNIVTTNPSTRCGIGTTTLGATADAGAILEWYPNLTGGSAIGTGSVFTTPTISSTTPYYVGAANPTTINETAGPVALSASNELNSSYGSHGVIFTTTKSNVTVVSSKMYIAGTGTIVISLRNSTGTEIANTGTIAVAGTGTTSALTVPINLLTTTPGDYQLIVNSATGITGIWCESTPTYPYPSLSGGVSVTAGYWYGTDLSAHRFFYNVLFNYTDFCRSARTMVTATVTPPPALTLNSVAPICAGSGIATLSVTSTVSDYTSYVWTPTTGLYTDAAATTSYTGASTSMVYVKSSTVGMLNYITTGTNTTTGCANVTSTTLTILDAPNSLTVAGTPNPICANATLTLSAIANAVPVVAFMEDFNAPTNAFTTTNLSTTTGTGTLSLAAWTLRNSPYVGSSVSSTLTSNDASQFYLTDSDAPGSGSKTRTRLQTPAINTTTLTTLNLNFYHYYNYNSSSDSAKVEVSTNGTTWTSLVDYARAGVDVGTGTGFVPTTINLNAYVGFPTVYVRFNNSSSWGYGWAIDNVKLDGTTTSAYTYAWTSAPAGFTSAIASPTTMATSSATYSVVITNTATSCSNSGVVSVTVNPVPTVTATTSSSLVCAGSPATLTATSTETAIAWSTGAATATTAVNPTLATVYTASVTNAFGCKGTSTVAVNVNALPTVTATASSSVICKGSNVTLNAATTETSIAWSTGATTASIVATPTVPSVYTVSVTNTNGCVKSSSVSVNINALPNVTANSSGSVICTGDNVSLFATTTESTTVWSTGATTSSITASPTLTTVYSVSVTNAAGCVGTASITIIVNPCTGIQEAQNLASVSIYPNPTNGIVTVSLPNSLTQNSTLEVYDAIGKLVVKQVLNNELNTINITNLSEGMYTFKVLNNNNIVKFGKIIKN